MRGPSYLGLSMSVHVSWLLMPWLLASPGHQHPWYWLCRIGKSLFYIRKDFNNLCHVSVEEWHKMWVYVFGSFKKNIACKGLKQWGFCSMLPYGVTRPYDLWGIEPLGGTLYWKFNEIINIIFWKRHCWWLLQAIANCTSSSGFQTCWIQLIFVRHVYIAAEMWCSFQ